MTAPVVEILTVSALPDPSDQLCLASLNRPQAGSTSDAFVLDLSGTVIPREGTARSVEVIADGIVVREIPITFPRPAVARSLPGIAEDIPCGFRALLGVLRLKLEFELEFRAVLEDGRRFPICSVTGRRTRPATSFVPTRRPIMVTSLGRSGTTWLMGMLGGHPGIVIQDAYRLEGWPARYWTHMLQVLSDPADATQADRVDILNPDRPNVAPNPFYGVAEAADHELGVWLGRTHVERLAAFCLQNVEDWYAIAVREQGKESPAYFAEKNLLRYPRPSEPVSELYPDAKELFLVRDFRDVACSYISFHRRYGRDADEHIRATMPKLARRLIAEWRDRRADAHLVHYEDLVSEPVRTLEGIAHYLEIDSAQHTIGEMLRAGSDDERFRSHGTSPALEETVGRWRREGDESFRDQLNDAYRGPLAELGYTEDTTGATGGPRSAR